MTKETDEQRLAEREPEPEQEPSTEMNEEGCEETDDDSNRVEPNEQEPTSTEMNEEGCEETDDDSNRVEPNEFESRSPDQIMESQDLTDGGQRLRWHSVQQSERVFRQDSLEEAENGTSLSPDECSCFSCLHYRRTGRRMVPFCLSSGEWLPFRTNFQTSQSPGQSENTHILSCKFFRKIFKFLVFLVATLILITTLDTTYNFLNLNSTGYMTASKLNKSLHSDLEEWPLHSDLEMCPTDAIPNRTEEIIHTSFKNQRVNVSIPCEKKWPLHSKLQKWPADAIFNRPEEIIHTGFKNRRVNISKHYLELPFWLTEYWHVSISVMYLTPTSTPTSTRHPSAVIALLPPVTLSQDLTIAPTPPLSAVPSVVLSNPMVQIAIFPSLLMESERQCLDDLENKATSSETDFSTPILGTLETDCPAEAAAYCVQETLPGCVHDCHTVERHCPLCNVWVCLVCSRANFISTMGREHLVHRRLLQPTGEDPGITGYYPLHCTYSLELNWWQRNMRHKRAFPVTSQMLQSLITADEGSDTKVESDSDSAQYEHHLWCTYKAVMYEIRSLYSVINRILTVTDAEVLTRNSLMEYLNDYYIIDNTRVFGETLVLHRYALTALRRTGTHVQNVDALRTICQNLKAQVQEMSARKKTRKNKLKKRLGRHQPAKLCIEHQGLLTDKECRAEAGLSSQRLEKVDLADRDNRQCTTKALQQSQPGTSSGFWCEFGDSRERGYESSAVNTGEVQPDTCAQTSTNRNHLDTCLAYTGGARPKTRIRGKTKAEE